MSPLFSVFALIYQVLVLNWTLISVIALLVMCVCPARWFGSQMRRWGGYIADRAAFSVVGLRYCALYRSEYQRFSSAVFCWETSCSTDGSFCVCLWKRWCFSSGLLDECSLLSCPSLGLFVITPWRVCLWVEDALSGFCWVFLVYSGSLVSVDVRLRTELSSICLMKTQYTLIILHVNV